MNHDTPHISSPILQRNRETEVKKLILEMACYAALLSLFHTLNNIKIHPCPPISLDQNQVESLTQNLTFFQDFLESYPNEEDDDLESRIIAAAYAAEDLIEIHIVDQIHAKSNITTVDLSQGLDLVIQDMDLIRNELMQIKKDIDTNSSVSGGPAASTWQSNITPVFDDSIINEVLDKLTGQQSDLQIIPIVGMGGIGKTALATSLYTNPFVIQHFDILAWVTISQEYSRGNILQLLCKETKAISNDLISGMSEDKIGEKIYKRLWGRRYLIVMDDIWNIEAWDQVKSFFPHNTERSRIMMTTRLSNLAFELSSCHVFQMQFLDEDKSWDLLCEIVFGKQDCPVELENVGKEIARKCKGLPLSIAVIGGLLRKSNMTLAYWIYTIENLNLLINLENDEYTLRILRTSYKELPMHLKPCFLYMGFFSEDDEIKIKVLIKLWVAEGILRPINDKSLEEVAEEYLKELIDRNLILIVETRWDGEARVCKIHDLLRDVCLREAQKQKFFCVVSMQQKDHTPQDINMERRICINPEKAVDKYSLEFLHAVETAVLTRSLLCRVHAHQKTEGVSPSLHFRLLRVFSSVAESGSRFTGSDNAIFKQANMRYLFLVLGYWDAAAAPSVLSLFSLLWNLQTFVVYGLDSLENLKIASKIWEMPLLRHATFYESVLPDPPIGEHNFVLENLQTLVGIMNLKFSEEMIKRIPNVKRLGLVYANDGLDEEELPDLYLHNLGRLQKLESLTVRFFTSGSYVLEKVRRNLVSFPHSLKKLTLTETELKWEDLAIRIGSLPVLQVLKLKCYACVGPEWETIEGHFCSLRILKIEECYDLKYWETDSSHFPCLEHLSLYLLEELEEIPSSIGDILTLKSMRVKYCNRTASDSAKRIKEEQEEYENEDLRVIIEEYSSDSDEEHEEDEDYSEEED